MTQQGQVIATYGRHYRVELENGTVRHCYTRGKKTGVCVGDYVTITPHGSNEGTIEAIAERQNLLFRSDKTRSRQFAANVDQLLLVLATEPKFSLDLLGRALTAAWAAHIDPLIILNKCDLKERVTDSLNSLQDYLQLGVPIVQLSALNKIDLEQKLTPYLQQKTSLLLGQSGMGKSTILNALIPEAQSQTQEFSQALGTGKHTTTSTTLYHLPNGKGDLIDSPGFQAFGLQHLDSSEISKGFPEFYSYIQNCRFYNCMHLHEPNCGVLHALQEGKISQERYALYQRIIAENQ